MFDLSGKTALVTGAGGMGSGTGAGIARALAQAGARVVINDRDAAGAARTVDVIQGDGNDAVALPFDVTDYDAVAAAIGGFGDVDILVNNAGGAMGLTQFRDSEPASWRAIIDLNLFGVLNCTRAVINGMCDRGWGRVISISSGAGSTGLAIGVSPYAAAKGGVMGFMRHLSCETAGFGVTSNTVALGLMGRSEDDTPHEAHNVGSQVHRSPIGRLGKPSDPAALCVYLASNEAMWVTGQTMHVNGGAVTS